MDIEIFTAFYGNNHLRMFSESLMPSLELPSNLPALRAAGHNLIHHVYCTTWEAPHLPAGCIVNTDILAHPHGQRERVALCFQEAIRRNRLVIIAQCDSVFGHGMARTILGLVPGEVLVAGHPRINCELCDQLLPAFLESEMLLGNDGNRRFVKFFMETTPHPMVEHGKTNAEPYWRTTRRNTHWETFFKEPPPVAFFGSNDMLDAWPGSFGSLEVIDHDLIDMSWRRGKLRWVSDSRDFIWAERTSKGRYDPTIRNSIWLDSCKLFNTEPLRWYCDEPPVKPEPEPVV